MNKKIVTLIMVFVMSISMAFTCFAVPVQNTDEVYMGLTVSSDWRVLSKNMTDKKLLEALDLTAEEVNEMLVNGECERIIINAETKAIVNVKIEENALTEDLYNITEAEDKALIKKSKQILAEGFSVNGLEYSQKDVMIEKYSQAKFIIVPGKVENEGRKRGVICAVTIINGKGVGFVMPLESAAIRTEDMDAFLEVVSSTTFTAIKDKGEEKVKDEVKKEETEKPQGATSYIFGGLGALILAAICLYLFDRFRKSPKTEVLESPEDSNDEESDQ